MIMDTLTEIKDQYAQEQGYEDWADLYRRAGYYDERVFFMHENVVIILAQKAALENAAENAITDLDFHLNWYSVNKESITSEQNLIR